MKPDLKYSGIVFTLVNMQTNIAKDTIESVKETFGKHIKVYESYIPNICLKLGDICQSERKIDEAKELYERCYYLSAIEKKSEKSPYRVYLLVTGSFQRTIQVKIPTGSK